MPGMLQRALRAAIEAWRDTYRQERAATHAPPEVVLTDPLALRLDALMRRAHAVQPDHSSRRFVAGFRGGRVDDFPRQLYGYWEAGPYQLIWASEPDEQYFPHRLQLTVKGTRNRYDTDGGDLVVWADGTARGPGPWQWQIEHLADVLERAVIEGEAAQQAHTAEAVRQWNEECAARWEQARALAAGWSPSPTETLTSKEG